MLLTGEDYLECMSKQIETIDPFGSTPRLMKVIVTQAFVAARSYVQGLVVGGEVIRKVSQVRFLSVLWFILLYLMITIPTPKKTHRPMFNCSPRTWYKAIADQC